MSLVLIACFGLGALLGYWLHLSNHLSSKIGKNLLFSKPPRTTAYLVVSGIAYCLLMLLGLAICLALTHFISGGTDDALWAMFFGMLCVLVGMRVLPSRSS
jgi:hypothetical protein